VPQAQLRQRIRGQKQFKGEAGAETFRAGLQELVNAGLIRKADVRVAAERARKKMVKQ